MASGVSKEPLSPPKAQVPRTTTETLSPVLPSRVYRMAFLPLVRSSSVALWASRVFAASTTREGRSAELEISG
jgi:hypothetical protein